MKAASLKLVLSGDGAVGKTSLAQHASSDFGNQSSNYTLTKDYKDTLFNVSLVDTAGQDDFDSQRARCYEGADVIIISFSIIAHASYDHVQTKWVEESKKYAPNKPIVLVGTKKDLRDDQEMLKRLASRNLAPLTVQQGKALAKSIGAYAYFEVSCTDNKDVNELLVDCIRLIQKQGAKNKKGESRLYK